MDASLVSRFGDQRVPRYTSYPTTPHFTAAVGAEAYRGWLAALTPDRALSLYLHVPFCRTLCSYCGCHTKAARRDEPIDRYGEALLREIDLVAAALPARLPVVHVHWGGGTPTILAPSLLAAIMARLRESFAVTPEAEIAVEIDPRRLGPDTVAALAAAGVNRASLGIQSFDPAVQRAINRVQSLAVTEAAARALRAAGIARLNLDLLYGLPHQTVAACRDTAAKALALAPDRLAVFGYAHLPSLKKHQRLIDAAALPDAAARLAQYRAIAEVLTAAGYAPIGLDHFARPDDALARRLGEGRLRRNFQGYTADLADVLLGFGASSIGALPQGYVQNAAPVGVWQERIAAGRLAISRGLALTPEDRLRRDIIERIMCDLGVDLAGAARRHGVSPAALADEIAALRRLAEEGIVRLAGDVLEVPEASRPLLRSVAAVFDAYLPRAPAHHSLGI